MTCRVALDRGDGSSAARARDCERLLSLLVDTHWHHLARARLGAAPLIAIIAAAALGLWPDPNPNPIGPGLLFFFTFWPAVLCIVVGVIRVRLGQRRGAI